MLSINLERALRRALIIVGLTALGLGLLAWNIGCVMAANWIWAVGTFPGAAISCQAALALMRSRSYRCRRRVARSGTLNAGETFETQASATVRMHVP